MFHVPVLYRMRLRYHVGVNRTVFNMMLQLGFLRDVITYDALFNACAKGQLTERTLLLFHRCGSCDSSLMWSPAALVSACEMDWKMERVVLESLLFLVSGVWGCFGFLCAHLQLYRALHDAVRQEANRSPAIEPCLTFIIQKFSSDWKLSAKCNRYAWGNGH